MENTKHPKFDTRQTQRAVAEIIHAIRTSIPNWANSTNMPRVQQKRRQEAYCNLKDTWNQ